jgi:hypothetical protein
MENLGLRNQNISWHYLRTHQKMLTFDVSKITVSWDVTLCSLMDECQHFGRTSCVHLQFCFDSEWGSSNFS